MWGSGPCLGCGPDTVSLRPRVIEELQTVNVNDVVSGDSHCLALTVGLFLSTVYHVLLTPSYIVCEIMVCYLVKLAVLLFAFDFFIWCRQRYAIELRI